eukprot:TRINITY_DN67467_c5_g2_i1.p1 TRINITY_DN67467_c5_g2~~TRINITY_DN67467_c5_g2_i1.p1  ORF type:complete len:481 (-),score=51.48 TRINITY_DN67467_c5_g2_i1:823-2265(-)
MPLDLWYPLRVLHLDTWAIPVTSHLKEASSDVDVETVKGWIVNVPTTRRSPWKSTENGDNQIQLQFYSELSPYDIPAPTETEKQKQNSQTQISEVLNTSNAKDITFHFELLQTKAPSPIAMKEALLRLLECLQHNTKDIIETARTQWPATYANLQKTFKMDKLEISRTKAAEGCTFVKLTLPLDMEQFEQHYPAVFANVNDKTVSVHTVYHDDNRDWILYEATENSLQHNVTFLACVQFPSAAEQTPDDQAESKVKVVWSTKPPKTHDVLQPVVQQKGSLAYFQWNEKMFGVTKVTRGNWWKSVFTADLECEWGETTQNQNKPVTTTTTTTGDTASTEEPSELGPSKTTDVTKRQWFMKVRVTKFNIGWLLSSVLWATRLQGTVEGLMNSFQFQHVVTEDEEGATIESHWQLNLPLGHWMVRKVFNAWRSAFAKPDVKRDSLLWDNTKMCVDYIVAAHADLEQSQKIGPPKIDTEVHLKL